MVVRAPGGGYGDMFRYPAMPTPLRVTVLVFALLSLLFTLATAHRLIAGGSFGAAVFFAVMAVACALVALSLVGRRPWAPYPAYALAGLLAAASLGLFGTITCVGLALLAWVLWACNVRASRDWLGGRRRLR
ncbi:hypothetical protein [Micromonospora endophytica]|uniref:DUF4233 domain-containing protein n=2 Tax=Micromonospora endophytica TaxID=515350 RepID=A0A2W2D2K4_9ACTN|nr:hypothetical protein [Micromonospora endophytica]PZF99854.1 hypothetical protein C1I93_04390 [Micromonospora endophytica]RIW41826.1 hypothetical protein D3H59_24830 [Micromonospora endophytica]